MTFPNNALRASTLAYCQVIVCSTRRRSVRRASGNCHGRECPIPALAITCIQVYNPSEGTRIARRHQRRDPHRQLRTGAQRRQSPIRAIARRNPHRPPTPRSGTVRDQARRPARHQPHPRTRSLPAFGERRFAPRGPANRQLRRADQSGRCRRQPVHPRGTGMPRRRPRRRTRDRAAGSLAAAGSSRSSSGASPSAIRSASSRSTRQCIAASSRSLAIRPCGS